jgi:molybdenum cofactor synthesis domain-containing protein
MSASETTACVILIGNELLSGRTQDTNLAHLGKQLDKLGVRLNEARVVRDDVDEIIQTVNECRQKFDYVFTTGGIGPTHDDITTECIAKAFGVAVELRDDAVQRMGSHYNNTELTPARLKMARVPEGATLVDNPVSAAPGYRIDNVFVFAGIPAIMRAMFDSARHELKGGPPMLSRSLAAYLGEGVIATGLNAIQDRYADVSIGSYPFVRDGRFGASLVMRGTDPARLDAAYVEVRALIVSLGAEAIDGA